MSAGGLLGAALLGGIQGGAQTAVKVGEQRRERAWEQDMADLKNKQALAMEQMRFDNNMAVSKYEQGARAKESALDRASNERIAGMRAKNSGKAYLDPMVKARLDTINSEIEAIYGREMIDETDRKRLAGLVKVRDQMLGLSGNAGGTDGGNPPLSETLGTKVGEDAQSKILPSQKPPNESNQGLLGSFFQGAIERSRNDPITQRNMRGGENINLNSYTPGLLNPDAARTEAAENWESTPREEKLEMAKGDVAILLRQARRSDGSLNQRQLEAGAAQIAEDLGLSLGEIEQLLHLPR